MIPIEASINSIYGTSIGKEANMKTPETFQDIDKRINQLNAEATTFNKMLKHYKSWMECLDATPDKTFIDYINENLSCIVNERSLLLNKKKAMLENYLKENY